MDTSPRIRASQEPDGHHQECSQRERTLGQRRSSCLWFQIVGVETYLLSRSYSQAAQVPSSNVTCKSPRSPWMNCRMMLALVAMTHSITIFPAAFRTAIEILS